MKKKKNALEGYKKISKALLKKVIIAFEDEIWLNLNPTIKASWMKKGYQKIILTPGKNKRINAFYNPSLSKKSIKYNIFKKRNSKILKTFNRTFKAY
jgi:hypothetical protein